MSFNVLLSQRELNVPCQLSFELENTFQAQPFFARFCFGQRLLESPHELLPSLYLRILLVRLRFLFKRKALVYFHDQEHARAEQVDLQIFDKGVPLSFA